MDYDKMIDCAAIKAPDGSVWTGKRHHHCIKTIIQARVADKVGSRFVQGFVTMAGRFVDRKEAAMLAKRNGQAPDCGRELFSEDLY